MWVTPFSPSRIRVRSSSICTAGRPSKSRRPWPKRTGTTWSSSSSRIPAASANWATAAPMDQDVRLACGLLCPGHRRLDVVDVGDQGPAADVDAGLAAAVDEDRYPVV